MRAFTLLGSAALLLGTASSWAIPNDSGELFGRDGLPADATSPWIEVDDEGQPRTTHTPSMTTISGTPTAINGAPHDLTADVYTWTTWGVKSTSTGSPPNPTATAKSGQGAFTRCRNMDGDFAPFCRPSHNSTLLTGNTYYVTWDPDYYNKTHDNTTWDVGVRLDYLNTTGHVNKWTKLKTYKTVPASWGFWPLEVNDSLLKGHKVNNVTITLLSSRRNSNQKFNSTTLPIAITKPGFPENPPTEVPKGKNLTIALPAALGTVALIVVGLFLWHRRTRRIRLGNVMSRSRHGYTGRGVRRRMNSRKDPGIQLDTRAVPTSPGDYHDNDRPGMPRRDSDGLGSLASSPVDPTFEHQGTTGGNAFRDELERQRRDDEGRL